MSMRTVHAMEIGRDVRVSIIEDTLSAYGDKVYKLIVGSTTIHCTNLESAKTAFQAILTAST